MRSRARLLALFIAAGALVATVAAPATSGATTVPSRRQRCTAGVTFRALKSATPRAVVVKAKSANVRRQPGTDCPRFASVKRGTRLNATGARAKARGRYWLEVDGTFGRGWMAAGLVR